MHVAPALPSGDPEAPRVVGRSGRDVPTRRDVEACRAFSDLDLDLDAALLVWEEAMTLPDADQASTPRWYHGDLLAENLLVCDGRLTAVLDFGGLAVGDPTVDLVVAWEVLEASSREVFRRAVEADEESWLRDGHRRSCWPS